MCNTTSHTELGCTYVSVMPHSKKKKKQQKSTQYETFKHFSQSCFYDNLFIDN